MLVKEPRGRGGSLGHTVFLRAISRDSPPFSWLTVPTACWAVALSLFIQGQKLPSWFIFWFPTHPSCQHSKPNSEAAEQSRVDWRWGWLSTPQPARSWREWGKADLSLSDTDTPPDTVNTLNHRLIGPSIQSPQICCEPATHPRRLQVWHHWVLKMTVYDQAKWQHEPPHNATRRALLLCGLPLQSQPCQTNPNWGTFHKTPDRASSKLLWSSEPRKVWESPKETWRPNAVQCPGWISEPKREIRRKLVKSEYTGKVS